MKESHLWIYEFNDKEELVGATLYEGFASDLIDRLDFPHLSPDWGWKMEVTKQERKNENGGV
jgi:hypothetical protein